jgi:hypothetical protein
MTTSTIRDLDPCPACHGSGSKIGPGAAPGELRQMSIGGLAAEAAAVLWDSERWGLPGPRNVTVYSGAAGAELSFQFGDTPASFTALAQWADFFGGTITSKNIRHNGPARLCRVKFTYHGVPADAYAIVPATTAIL